ncbi:MAG: TetR/AcrR family transcriptional regulator [Ktedonobacterales bacterium]|nr:TetR/AcrR family transcriptional regulator [Ktedonobacterales bacterium]
MARTPAQPGVDRRQQILDAALDAFAEHGFEGATTTQIAASARATQGLIYFYFPKGKEELFAAAFEHQAKRTLGALDFAALAVADEAPELTLRRMVERFIAVMGSAHCASMIRIMMRTIANTGSGDEHLSEARKCGLAQVRRLINEMSAYLEQQVARATLRPMDTRLAARLMIGGMMMLLRSAEPEELAESHRGALADQIASMYIHGLLPATDASG